MRVFETVEIVAASLPFIALGLGGDLFTVCKAGYWSYQGISQMIEDSNGNRTYTCGICGEEGHNRRTCYDNVTCGGCGNEEPEEVWEKDGNTVCNDCI